MKHMVATALIAVAVGVMTTAGVAKAEPGTRSALAAITGEGTGQVSIAPTASARPYFDVQVEVAVHGLQPETTYTVERTPDFVPDGVCTGESGIGWIVNGTLTTSAGGAGTAHYHVELGSPFVSDFTFDILFRVVGEDGTELRTECMTVTAK